MSCVKNCITLQSHCTHYTGRTINISLGISEKKKSGKNYVCLYVLVCLTESVANISEHRENYSP